MEKTGLYELFRKEQKKHKHLSVSYNADAGTMLYKDGDMSLLVKIDDGTYTFYSKADGRLEKVCDMDCSDVRNIRSVLYDGFDDLPQSFAKVIYGYENREAKQALRRTEKIL